MHPGRRKSDSTGLPFDRRRPRLVRLCGFCLRETGSTLMFAVAMPALLIAALLAWSTERDLSLPFVARAVEARLADAAGDGRLAIGGLALRLGHGDRPSALVARDVALLTPDGQAVARAPEITSGFTLLDALRGQFRPESLIVEGGRAHLARDEAGRIALTLGDASLLLPQGGDAAAAGPLSLAGGDFLANVPMLAALDDVRFTEVSISFDDRLTGSRWRAEDGLVTFHRDAASVRWQLQAAPVGPSGRPGTVSATVTRDRASGETSVAVRFAGARPSDLALHATALGWLQRLEADASGELQSRFAADGTLLAMTGRLDLGQGEVAVSAGETVAFDHAVADFDYDPRTRSFDFSDLALETTAGDIAAGGALILPANGGADGLVAQLDIRSATLRDPGRLEAPIHFDEGRADLRIGLDPLKVDLGSLALRQGRAWARAEGSLALAPEDGWQVAVDAEAEGLDFDRFLVFWPTGFRPGTRGWLASHIEAGTLTTARASLRLDGGKPHYDVDFAFDGGRASILDTMPAIEAARGTGRFAADRLALQLAEGEGRDAAGRRIDLKGSSFTIADVTRKPSTGEAVIAASGPIPALLDVIDRPPLGFVTRMGQTTGFATGNGRVTARLTLPMRHDLKATMITASAEAELSEVASDSLVPGHPATAEALTLTADNLGMRVAGQALLSGVPFDFTFAKGFAQGDGPGNVEGTFPLSPETLADLGIALPSGSVAGSTTGHIAIGLADGDAPDFRLTADLAPARLSIPALGWGKAPGKAAEVSVAGRLGQPVDVQAVTLKGPGLTLAGDIDLGGGGLQAARFDRLAVGGWLDAPVRLRPGQGGRGIAEVNGGTIDLRGQDFSGSGDGGYDLVVKPDRLLLSDGIALTALDARLTMAGGMAGPFTGRVNGGTVVEGRIDPSGRIVLSAADGGAALRDAGIYQSAHGGVLRAVLSPDPATGGYSGDFLLKGTRVTDAPVMAELLRVASVVGIADALSGPGIGFDDVAGHIRLTRAKVVVTNARAVSASLGISANGVYSVAGGDLDIEGVVSPMYFVNGFFEKIPGLGRVLGGRNGEGLIGVGYSMRGPAANPRITVNPLSVLTPGAFRGIFQRDPGMRARQELVQPAAEGS